MTMSAFDLMMPMIDVADRLPPAGQTVLLRGTSGYMRAGGLDVRLGFYEPEYPRAPWRDIRNDSIEDDGFTPTHWAPVANLPANLKPAR